MKLSMRLGQRKYPDGRVGNYFVEFDNGQRRSLKTADKTMARRLFRKIRKEYLFKKVAHITGACRTNLGDYQEEFLEWSGNNQPTSTFRANRLALEKLISVSGKKIALDRLSLKHIDLLVTAERKKSLSVRSINNYIRHARASMNKAVEWGYIKENPLKEAKELRVQRKRPTYLTKEQSSRFIASVKDIDLRRLIVAYLATGRRRSELLKLTWEDIDLKAGRYTVTVKGNKKQQYPINAVFGAVLDSIGRDTGRVFNRWKHADTISHQVKIALIDAGHPGLTLHSLRHTFATIKAGEGRSLKEIQELLGHSEQRVTEIYAHLTDDHLAEISEVNLGPIDLFGTKK